MLRALAPLRHREFRLLATGQLTSNVGDAFFAVALPWYVLSGHGGVLLLGAVLTAYGIPRTVVVAFGGYAADRWTPWSVMMVADTTRAVATCGLAVIAAAGPADAGLLLPVAVVLGAGEGLFLPSSMAIVPALLPDQGLQAGNALTSGGTQLATLIGPAIGGGVVALVGPATAFGVDAVTFAASTFTLRLVRSHQRPQSATADGEITTAPQTRTIGLEQSVSAHGPTPTLRTLLSERVLQVILITTVAANLGSGGLSEVALPSLAHGPLHAGATGYGALIAAFGGGALLGTILAALSYRPRRQVLIGSFAELIAAGCLAAVPYLGGAIPAAGALLMFGMLIGLANVVYITAIQRWAAPALMGRLMGLLTLSGYGIFPVSVLLGSITVHTLGPAPVSVGIGAPKVRQSAWVSAAITARASTPAASGKNATLPWKTREPVSRSPRLILG